MSLRYRSIKVAASLLILLAFVSGSLADTLRLKDGSIIKGKIEKYYSTACLVDQAFVNIGGDIVGDDGIGIPEREDVRAFPPT